VFFTRILTAALEENRQEQRKLLKAVREFGTYITANRRFIVNYGDRYRHGETISTAFVESAINQVLSKRFVKRPTAAFTFYCKYGPAF
jgi:hypothetical protein